MYENKTYENILADALFRTENHQNCGKCLKKHKKSDGEVQSFRIALFSQVKLRPLNFWS